MSLHLSESPASTRDRLWRDSRNSLSIARLLAHEGRPEPLLATACRAAVEAACRAALEQRGAAFDGDLERAFERLAVPDDLIASIESAVGRARLDAAERAVGWLADHLRAEAPEKTWGY